VKLEFFRWLCGHRMQRPEPIDEVASEAQAAAILQAIAAAITEPGTAAARLLDGGRFREYYLAEDHVSVYGVTGGWTQLPTVFTGPGLVGNVRVRAAQALGWHHGLTDDPVLDWDGTRPLGGIYDGAYALTSLTAEQVRALPHQPEAPPLRVIEVTPELMREATRDAIESSVLPALFDLGGCTITGDELRAQYGSDPALREWLAECEPGDQFHGCVDCWRVE